MVIGWEGVAAWGFDNGAREKRLRLESTEREKREIFKQENNFGEKWGELLGDKNEIELGCV